MERNLGLDTMELRLVTIFFLYMIHTGSSVMLDDSILQWLLESKY